MGPKARLMRGEAGSEVACARGWGCETKEGRCGEFDD